MYRLAISTGGLIALSVVVTAAVIFLIILAVRLTRNPRNRLISTSPDLVDRAREFKAHGQLQEAIFLVAGETGMSQRAATRIVRRL